MGYNNKRHLENNKSMIKQISHISLSCTNLSKTKYFYNKILKLPIIHYFKNKHNKIYGFILYAGNATFLEFFKCRKLKKDKLNLFRHLCLNTKSLADLKKSLLTKKINLVLRRGRTDKTLQAWTSDPDNNIIEFHQIDKNSKLKKFQTVKINTKNKIKNLAK